MYTDFGTSQASSQVQQLQLRLKTDSKGKPNIPKEYVLDYSLISSNLLTENISMRVTHITEPTGPKFF